MSTPNSKAFGQRLHLACERMGVPPQGRYTALARRLTERGHPVTYQATKKWLDGTGYPVIEHGMAIADMAGVTINWLYMGTPPMLPTAADNTSAILAEAITSMPAEERRALLQYTRFQLNHVQQWFAEEDLRRYELAIDTLSADPGPQEERHNAPPPSKPRRAA